MCLRMAIVSWFETAPELYWFLHPGHVSLRPNWCNCNDNDNNNDNDDDDDDDDDNNNNNNDDDDDDDDDDENDGDNNWPFHGCHRHPF